MDSNQRRLVQPPVLQAGVFDHSSHVNRYLLGLPQGAACGDGLHQAAFAANYLLAFADGLELRRAAFLTLMLGFVFHSLFLVHYSLVVHAAWTEPENVQPTVEVESTTLRLQIGSSTS